MQETRQLATMLGGRLEIPELSWKYVCIQRLFGFALAKRFSSVESLQIVHDQVLAQGIILFARAENMIRQLESSQGLDGFSYVRVSRFNEDALASFIVIKVLNSSVNQEWTH